MFGKRKSKNEAVDLDDLITIYGQGLEFWTTQPEPQVLARGRFGDACRNVNVRPVSESMFASAWNGLDSHQLNRFCLFVSSMDVAGVPRKIKELGGETGDAEFALRSLSGLSKELSLLTADVLQQSDIRLEEFARHFGSSWKLSFKDESEKVSTERLHQINFGRLMKEAEAAKNSAEDRLEYLRKLQEEQEEQRRPRRGKW